MTTTIYLHDHCLDHYPGPQHPESPGRYAAILQAVRGAAPSLPGLVLAEAPLGTREQVLLAHDEEHWRHIEAASPLSGRHSLDPDTHLSPARLHLAHTCNLPSVFDLLAN